MSRRALEYVLSPSADGHGHGHGHGHGLVTKKKSHISETGRFNPLKSNSPLYKPHQKKPLQERNFFFLKKFTQPLTADFAIFGVPRLPGKGGPEGKSATAIPFLPSSRYL